MKLEDLSCMLIYIDKANVLDLKYFEFCFLNKFITWIKNEELSIQKIN